MEERQSSSSHPRHQEFHLGGPVLLIGLGVLLLLNSTGQLDTNLWDLLQLWPLFIIGAGVEMLIGRRSLVGAFVAALLILALFGGGVWYVGRATVGVSGKTVTIEEPRGDADKLRAEIAPAVARLQIGALNDSDNLVEGSVTPHPDEEITSNLSSGATPRLVVKTAENTSLVTTGAPRVWELDFNRDVALDLSVNMGVGEANLALKQLAVERLDVNVGVGTITLRLPDQSDVVVTLNAGVGAITLKTPPGVGVRLRTDSAIVGRAIPSTYSRDGDVYTSPGYDAAKHHLNVTVAVGIGSLTVVEDRGE